MRQKGGGKGPSLTHCYTTLLGVAPTSLQPERDFSLVRALLGKTAGVGVQGRRRYFLLGEGLLVNAMQSVPSVDFQELHILPMYAYR